MRSVIVERSSVIDYSLSALSLISPSFTQCIVMSMMNNGMFEDAVHRVTRIINELMGVRYPNY